MLICLDVHYKEANWDLTTNNRELHGSGLWFLYFLRILAQRDAVFIALMCVNNFIQLKISNTCDS